jgi:hypothetical protein
MSSSPEMDDASFRPATNRARDVQGGGLRRSARNDEGLERLELLLALIDCSLELCDAVFIDASLRKLLAHLLRIGRREQRAYREQVALDGNEDFVYARHHLDGTRHPEHGVQLIDVAVGFDARMILADASAAEESRVAGVSGLRVDLDGHAT